MAIHANMLWFTGAILLLIIELFKINGYTLWLSVCAAIVAVLKTGLIHFSLSYQLTVFVVLAMILCVWWFSSLRKTPAPSHTFRAKDTVGQAYTLENPIKHGKGQIEIANLIWFVHSEHDLPKGSKVKVKGTNGVVLLVEEYLPTSN